MTPCAQSLVSKILNSSFFFFFFQNWVFVQLQPSLNSTRWIKLLGYNPVYAHSSKSQNMLYFMDYNISVALADKKYWKICTILLITVNSLKHPLTHNGEVRQNSVLRWGQWDSENAYKVLAEEMKIQSVPVPYSYTFIGFMIHIQNCVPNIFGQRQKLTYCCTSLPFPTKSCGHILHTACNFCSITSTDRRAEGPLGMIHNIIPRNFT